jgi:enamine deaminase RidA (YjgF/YER057c/UK114 family)
MTHQVLQPPGWVRPKGYSNGIAASGRFVFTAGVVGWNKSEIFEARDLPGQFRQVLVNIIAILGEGGAKPEHIVRITCYVISKRDYLANAPEIGTIWREIFGKVFPCMALVEVSALVEDAALVEMEVTAIIPETPA